MNKPGKSLLAAQPLVIGLIAALALMPATGMAQDVAVGTAQATILAAITVTATQALDFGDVLQGVATTVDKTTAASAGVFTITGESGNGISMYMQLPDYLALADNSDRMVISFSTTDANVDLGGTSAADPSAFLPAMGNADEDPHNLTDGVLTGATSYIYLGGKVIPSIDQKAGSYSGDIILTVAYNGT